MGGVDGGRGSIVTTCSSLELKKKHTRLGRGRRKIYVSASWKGRDDAALDKIAMALEE